MNAAIDCLLEWLDSHPSGEKPHRVLRALALETRKKLTFDPASQRFTAEELASAAGQESVADAKKWLDWRDSVYRYWTAREADLARFARDRGLQEFVRPERYSPAGGRGNVALYYLAPWLMAADTPDQEAIRDPTVVEYGQDPEPPMLSRPFRWLFPNNCLVVGSVRSWMLFFWVMGGLILVLLLGWLLLVTMLAPQPLTTRSIAALLTTALLAWIAWKWQAQPLLHILDDRIGKLDEILMSGTQPPGELEVFREPDRRVLKVVRYTTTCTVCGATVRLGRGDPEFARRLVGRCVESPREHLFSFDRVTLRGTPLRPPA